MNFRCRSLLLSVAVIGCLIGFSGCGDPKPQVIDGTQEEFDEVMSQVRAEEQASIDARNESDQ